MATHAVNGDIHGIDVRHRVAGRIADAPGGKLRIIMQRQADIGPWKAREQPICQHGARATATLLGGLADHDQRALPSLLELRQHPRRADDARHVHVMAARMHHGHVVARGIFRHYCAGVRQAGLLLHRQSIQISADQNRWPFSIPQNTHHSVFSDMGGHLESSLAQFLSHARGSFLFQE